jgi:hypothetical protein
MQVRNMTDPEPAVVDAAVAWLHANRFSDVTRSGDALNAHTTAALASAVFNTTVRRFESRERSGPSSGRAGSVQSARTCVRFGSAVHVPLALHAAIASVFVD